MEQKNTGAVSQKTGMARLIELAATKKGLILVAVVLSALASIVSFVPYIAIYSIVQQILSVYPDVSALDTGLIINYGWLAFAGVVGNILLYFCALMCSHLAAFGTLYELKVNFASHLAKVPLGFHVLIGSGKLRKVMDQNIEKIEEFIAHQVPDIVAAMVAPVVMLVLLIGVDWRMGLGALVGIAVALLLQMLAYGKEGAQKKMAEYQAALENMNNASVEYIRGIAVVKAFRQTAYSFTSLYNTIKKYTEFVIPYTLDWENVFSAYQAILNNIYLFVVPVAFLVGSFTNDYVTFAGKFLFYLIFVPAIAGIMTKVMYVNSNSMQILSGVSSMDKILAEPELSQPQSPSKENGYDIAFNNVSFSYGEAAEGEALSDVSFVAKQGEITAIVGPSGGGKSTIAHLIPRFFDVSSGSITMGGVDTRNITSPHLMEQVSFVFQDVFLFKQSVMDNIRMGRLDATDEDVYAAAKAAQCHEFVEKLPNGYQTVIGTDGVHLSGGEKQRLAIARAIVKDAPVIVLDEATAFADPENEHLIQKAFEKLMHGKTVIMIAHRLSTIRSADNIIVMDNGHLVESGTHDALLEKGGKYADMWEAYTHTISWSMGAGHKQKGGVQNG